MNKTRIIYILVICFFCFGCTKKDEKFIGIWSNKVGNLGDLQLTISRDGERLLVKKGLISSGQLFEMNNAKVEDGYIFIDGGISFYTKMSYSETEDALIPVYEGEAIPGFHRVK